MRVFFHVQNLDLNTCRKDMNVEKVLCGGGRLQPGRGGRTRAGNRGGKDKVLHIFSEM